MANIFNKTNQLYENPNRNTFQHDHSFHGTFNFGDLYPVLCKEVIPGTSVSINPTIALKMMPMLFPIQSRIKAYLHFFYVPYRTLWKDWMDFIGDTKKGLNKPFINPETTEIKTGSLADYLGLPTTVSGKNMYKSKLSAFDFILQPSMSYDSDYSFSLSPNGNELLTPVCTSDLYSSAYDFATDFQLSSLTWEDLFYDFNTDIPNGGRVAFFKALKNVSDAFVNRTSLTYFAEEQSSRFVFQSIKFDTIGNPFNTEHFYLCTYTKAFDDRDIEHILSNDAITKQMLRVHCSINGDSYILYNPVPYYRATSNNFTALCLPTYEDFISYSYYEENYELKPISDVFNDGSPLDILVNRVDIVTFVTESGPTSTFGVLNTNPEYNGIAGVPQGIVEDAISDEIYTDLGVVDISTLPKERNPYFSENFLIDAGPFRAYESIYNTYYRDDRNNPRIVNGEPVYNKFIPNDEGGLDDYPYKLHQRNWEQDFLTLSVQSPQQGIAPLVGITSRGEFQFKDEENGRLYTAQANYSSDGDTIESFTINSADMPKSSLRQLMTYATEGISISDLRNVNALQRWLEINMRRGYRYKDQIKSHFGVDVRYDELMMPEFIGGMSSDVFVNQINNTAQSDGNPLGAFAGQGSSIEKSNNTIHHYCQEHGYIIGILSLSPSANYSQLLPKHFTKREILDYYFPEFGHIGFQPIPYREVAPLSAYLAGKSLDDTFGYQRAWYDYLASNDSVHGLFRTSLKNFVVQRIFNSYPELSPEFLTIDHKDLDDIFAVESSDVSHKFFGEIFFDMKMKLPIPEYGTPKLEV